MLIKIQYPNHHSIPVCQYTSVFPENNVENKVNKTPKVVPWDALVYGSIMVFYLNLEKLRKSERCVVL